MALFPRKVGGRYLTVGRQDGKNITLLASDSLTDWDDEGQPLISPAFPWEFVQMGNCGSPIECDEGWILLTRSEEHTSELQSLMRISYAVFCLKKKKSTTPIELNLTTPHIKN